MLFLKRFYPCVTLMLKQAPAVSTFTNFLRSCWTLWSLTPPGGEWIMSHTKLHHIPHPELIFILTPSLEEYYRIFLCVLTPSNHFPPWKNDNSWLDHFRDFMLFLIPFRSKLRDQWRRLCKQPLWIWRVPRWHQRVQVCVCPRIHRYNPVFVQYISGKV